MAQSEHRTTGPTTAMIGVRLSKTRVRKIRAIASAPPDSPIRRRLKALGYSATVNGFLNYLLDTDERVEILLDDIPA